jgi:uncharacterized membrane protein YeaQ/YmgE (transglycosylase-associated protein family)
MGILLWIGIGLGIAFVANWKIPPKNRNGTFITFASATLGAIAGGIVSAGSSAESLTTVNGIGLICATGGACLALLAIQLLKTTLYVEH